MGWFFINRLKVYTLSGAAKGTDNVFYPLQPAMRYGDAVPDARTAQPLSLQEDLYGFLFVCQPAVFNQDGDQLLQDTLLVSGDKFPYDGIGVQYVRYLH